MKLLKPFVAEPATPASPPALTESDDELLALKEQFAELSLREPDPFKVALVLFPNDTGRALRIANEWPSDPAVRTFRQSFVDAEEEGESAFLPTKAEAARLAWNLARDSERDGETRHKFLKLYAEMRGFIEKPQVAVNNTVNNTVRVLVVKDHGSDEDWRTALKAQQKRLINGEYSKAG